VGAAGPVKLQISYCRELRMDKRIETRKKYKEGKLVTEGQGPRGRIRWSTRGREVLAMRGGIRIKLDHAKRKKPEYKEFWLKTLYRNKGKTEVREKENNKREGRSGKSD